MGTAGLAGAAGKNGQGGVDSYFMSASTVMAKGGLGGALGSLAGGLGGAGGAAASGVAVGGTKYSGGAGAKGVASASGGGGGSSAGTGSDGNPAGAAPAAGVAVTGGGPGGAGGSGAAGVAPVSGYGGGGGGAGKRNSTGGNGYQGKVEVIYHPPPSAASGTGPQTYSSGTISLNYTITDEDSDTGSIINRTNSGMKYSTNGQVTWNNCTAGAGGDGATGLAASPGGTAHVFNWNTAADISGEFTSTSVVVRVQPQDAYGYAASSEVIGAAFSVDNKAPVNTVPVAFVSDPVSGSSFQLSATFTDLNPNATWFGYMKNDDTDYTWANNDSPYTGPVVNGSDKFTAIMSSFTDRAGNQAQNALAAVKYVMPLAPSAPTFSNTKATTVSVTIVANPGETGTNLYYAVKANALYVQADGTLGASEVWKNDWPPAIPVIDLAPATLYTFSVAAGNSQDSTPTPGENSASAYGTTDDATTNPAPQPGAPSAPAVYLSSGAVAWTQVSSDNGYIVEASTAANFTGTLISSKTSIGTLEALSLIEPQLSSNTVYSIRVGSLWGKTTTYAATFTTATLANIVVNPQIYGVYNSSITANWLPRPASPLSDSCSGYILEVSPNPDFSTPVYSSATTQGVSVTTLTVGALPGATLYYVRYGTINNTHYVPNYYSTGAVATTLVPVPVDRAASAVYFSSIAVTWTSVDSLAGYIVQASTAANFTGTRSSSSTLIGTLSGLTVEAPRLSSNTVYNIRAGSLWGNTTGYASVFSTATLANIVVNPQAYGVFTTSITANWLPHPVSPLSDSCSGYILEASENPDFSGTVYSSATTQGVEVTTLTVTALSTSTLYYLRYGALNNTYYAPNYYSTGTTITTLALPPADPAASAVYLSSIDVTWTQIGSRAGYLVEASTAADFTGTLSSSLTVQGLSGLTVQVPQLSSNTVYNIRVGSLWGSATGYAAAFTAATLANIVENPQLYGVFQDSVTANWLPRPDSPLEDSCSGYILQADTDPNFTAPISSITTQGPTAVTTLTVTGLIGGTQYYFRFGTLNTAYFTPNYYSTGTVAVTQALNWGNTLNTVSSGTAQAGGSGWTTPENILSADGSYAAVPIGNVQADTVTAFGFNIPSQASILGIAVHVTGSGSAAGTRGFTVSLTKDGATAATSAYSKTLPTSNATVSAGAANDLWGTTWSPAEINDPAFGAIVTPVDDSKAQSYDWAGIQVFYSVPPPSDTAASAVYLSSITATWTTVGATAGYLVEASTAADFTGTLSSTLTIQGLSSLTVQVPQLSSNTVYNIRVGSLWSNTTTYAAAFTTATLANIVVNPQIYGIFLTSVTANWLPRPEAPLEDSCSGYILQADTDPDFTAPISSQTTQGPVDVTTLTVTGLTEGTQYFFRFGTLNNTHFMPNYYSTGTVASTHAGTNFVSCGLRYSPDGVSIVTFACEPPGPVTSPLRIYKAPDIYGIILVDPLDANASKFLINTGAGVKAIRKFP